MTKKTDRCYPVLPLRDVVVFPYMVIPLFVGREKSIKALEKAMRGNKQILLIAQKNASDDHLLTESIYSVGTIANILQLLKLPDKTIKVLVEGVFRVSIDNFTESEEGFIASATALKSVKKDERALEILGRSAIHQFERYVKLNNKVTAEVVESLSKINDVSQLADTMATHLSTKLAEKQRILEMLDVDERLNQIMLLIESEIDLMHVEKRIRGRVKSQMEKSQREYYLNEQMKAIQKELGEIGEAPNELDTIAKKIEEVGMPKDTYTKAVAELNKLKMMSPMSAEATVVRNYIDWLINVPWKARSRISRDLVRAEQILNEEHYGLEKVKDRILEYLAVQNRVGRMQGPILCLVGPPGVGKTSLGSSIARATNRKFCRMSLGGVRDEAEIRGHRRTYIGSMPGRIIQAMAKVEKKNPLFLFDEIDKMGIDFRGDPASALLEVFDPEQNDKFVDHYLEVDYNLSDVMFIATANSLDIPVALVDRMEIIHISGYTEDEKVHIAINYLVPKQIKKNGLKAKEISIGEETIRSIIRYYAREAGVRNLEREIAKICRKVVKEIADLPSIKEMNVLPENLEKIIGVKRFRFGKMEKKDRIGHVTGLAWTEMGGDLLTIEAAIVRGKGKAIRTGRLGDVMQESIEAAMTVVRSRSDMFGIPADTYKEHDFHVHVPEGATPKDGPSAGVAMCVSLLSAITKIPVRANVAMTGEITLRGEILPIGGLKEKLLAALRGGIEIVLIPKENARDLVEIPDNIKEDLDIRQVHWIDDVLQVALQHMPTMVNNPEQSADADVDRPDNVGRHPISH